MIRDITAGRIAADVKCYYCGHITGQVLGRKGEPLRLKNFVPRAGYTGPELRPGDRLRCERCNGPVFLEEAAIATRPGSDSDADLLRRLKRPKAA